jgi:transcriptional regulator with XRE-family HTH domain
MTPLTFNASHIEARREALGYSQAFVAQAVGITQPLLSRYEGSDTSPLALHLDKIAEVLQCTVLDFYDGDKSNQEDKAETAKAWASLMALKDRWNPATKSYDPE